MLKFLKRAVSDLFIASPADTTPRLVHRHGDQSIPNGAKLTVRIDEIAVFMREGQVVGVLPPGVHPLLTANIPFLGDLIVTPFTGDQHYLTELFFVRTTDHLHTTGQRPVGSFTDSSSQLLVHIQFAARFAIRVTDPVKMLCQLGGVRADAADKVDAFVDGRVASLLASCVGTLAAERPITQLVSNQFSEQIGQYTIEQARNAFASDGLALTRFLELQLLLDSPSQQLLVEYSKRAADLQIQKQGAEIAAQPGFAQFHLVQGQRAMLEGLGKHGVVMPIMAPMGLPMELCAGAPAAATATWPQSPVLEPSASSMSAVKVRLAAPTRWYLKTPKGIEGPYGARQIAVRALASRQNAETSLVREEGTSCWVEASVIEALTEEFIKRAQPVDSRESKVEAEREAFERTLSVATADGTLSTDELAILVGLARAAGLAPDDAAASEYVRTRARAMGAMERQAPQTCVPTSNPLEEPPPLPIFAYSDGVATVSGLTSEAVAMRVRNALEGTHFVWRSGMPGWVHPREVDEIARLLK